MTSQKFLGNHEIINFSCFICKKETIKIHRKSNPVSFRDICNRCRSHEYSQKVRNELKELLGNSCAICGTTKELNIDHINGGGRKETRENFHGSNWQMTKWYLAHPEIAKKKLQILCTKHNLDKEKIKKEYLYGELRSSTKLKAEQVISIRKEYNFGTPQHQLAKKYRVCQSNISRIISKRRWGWLD